MATIQHVSSTKTTPWFKYFATNLTSTSTFIATIPVLTTTRPTQLLPTIAPNGARFTGIEIMPFGTDAANEEVILTLNAVTLITDWGQDGSPDRDFVHNLTAQYFIRPITVITGTLKEQVAPDGAAGAYMGTADFTCDALTEALTNYGTALVSSTAPVVTNQTTGDGLGSTFIMPNFGNADFLNLGYDSGSSSASGNALIKLFSPTYQ